MSNKAIAYGLLISIGIAFLAAVLEPINEDGWYSIAGLGMVFFGIYSSVKLLKVK